MKNLFYLFLILFFCTNAFYSQSLNDIDRSYHIKQDGISYRFTVLENEPKIFNHRNTKTYYWYKAQKVLKTQGGSSGMLLDGEYESNYMNNQLSEKGKFKKGLKKGTWKSWDERGVLIAQEKWKRGRLKGKQYYYNEAGEINKRVRVKFRKSYTDMTDSVIIISGKKQTIYILDSLHNTIEVQRHQGNLLHGKQEVISEENVQSVKYRKGKLITPKEKKPEKEKDKGEKSNRFSKLKEKLKFGKKEESETSKKESKEKKDGKLIKKKTE